MVRFGSAVTDVRANAAAGDSPPAASGGFTLVEVLVALVLLEVGLMGVVGTLVLAARSLTRAELGERGVAAVEHVLDSLVTAGVTAGEGRVDVRGGEVVWRAAGGSVRLVFATALDSALVVVEAGSDPAEVVR
jgi:type II secretory pathway pseudopilin PulG